MLRPALTDDHGSFFRTAVCRNQSIHHALDQVMLSVLTDSETDHALASINISIGALPSHHSVPMLQRVCEERRSIHNFVCLAEHV